MLLRSLFPPKRITRIFILGIGLVIIVLGSWRGRNRPPVEGVIHNCDGSLSLKLNLHRESKNPDIRDTISFEVLDNNDKILFRCQTIASDRMRWRMGWDRENRIWLNSMDIGILCWEFDRTRDAWIEKSDLWKSVAPPDSVRIGD